ncbi:ATP-binding protein [Lactococcus lactis]|uniref:Conjugal transfer protein, DNA segregation ATPase n=1 Tax=Lactococcus lactis subsp. lactis A12 TaxID=1137134 RepID=S6F4K5_LACLL|nr:ATP-binding protein [Lactococcus lactis]CDG03734.1 Conjugal transfer protein, DNA segregation ATPase [Lactococcus lactis subsp. lactis A12]SBW29613.1 Conjugal transfer protein, DNA segregation ATPase [Lactococcus lactis subsp. lactis]
MQLDYPIECIHDNLALTKNHEAVAFYRLASFSTSVVDGEAREGIKRTIEQTIRKLFENRYFELSLVPRDYLLRERMEAMKATLYPPFQAAGEEALDEVTHRLTQEMEIPYQYEWVIAVFLSKAGESLQSFKRYFVNQVNHKAEQTMALLGRQVRLKSEWWEDFLAQENSVYQALQGLKPYRLNERQLFYHQRLQFLPYISHSYEAVLANRAVSNVTDTMIYPNQLGELKFVSEYGTSFLTILPIGKSNGLLDNNFIAEKIQSFNFPVGLKIKAHFPELGGALGYKTRLNQAFVRSKNIVSEAKRSGNVVYDRIVTGRQGLVRLAKDIEAKEPILEYGLFLLVVAKNQAQLRLRVQAVLNAFETAQIEVSRARFDQPYLFQSLLYGNKLSPTTRFWLHTSNSGGFAQCLPFTTHQSGSKSGFYLGRIDNNYGRWDNLQTALEASRFLVQYTPMLANKEDISEKVTKNLLTLITGETGSGKTVLALLIFVQSLLTTIKSLYVDPKHTLRKQFLNVANDPKWASKNPLLAKAIREINFVSLDAKKQENGGVLDPIVFLEPEDAQEVAKNMLLYLGGKEWTMEQRTAISRSVKATIERRKTGEVVGMKQVLEHLQKSANPQIKLAGEALFEMLDGSLLTLAFSDGRAKGIDFNQHATVLEVADLELPDEDALELNEDEKNSVALMMVLSTFCQRFGERDSKEETIEFFDEVWVLLKSKEGQKVIKSMRRVGRSESNKLVLITQSVNDVELLDDTTGAGERFTFYERGEEDKILEVLKLECSDFNREWLRNMNAGQCVYSDIFGHRHRISIDVPKNWLTLFSPESSTIQSQLEQASQER